MDKYERKLFLKKYGLNTPDCINISPKQGITEEQEKYIRSFKSLNMRVSRPERRRGSPIYMNIEPDELLLIINMLLKEGYCCLPGPYISFGRRVFSGTCWKKSDDDSLIVEIKYGPYTPREVTNMERIDERFISKEPNTNNEVVNNIIRAAKRIPVTNFILEFTYSREQVGEKRERLLFWDINDDGLKEPRFDAVEELKNRRRF